MGMPADPYGGAGEETRTGSGRRSSSPDQVAPARFGRDQEKRMKPASPHREGVIWGSCFSLCAPGFSLLVATGAAQAIIDLYIRLYKIAPPYQLGDFRFTTAMALILASTVAGFLGGLTRAIIWNLHVRRTTVGSETGDGQIASGSSPSTVVLVVYATREGRT